MNHQTQTWNQQQNQQQQQPLNEQELAFDLLYQEKAIMGNIVSDVLEVCNPGLRQVMNDSYLQIGQDQLNVFNAMNQLGFYQTKPAQAQDIQTAKQKYQQMRGTL